jgi:hypothetical protein
MGQHMACLLVLCHRALDVAETSFYETPSNDKSPTVIDQALKDAHAQLVFRDERDPFQTNHDSKKG